MPSILWTTGDIFSKLIWCIIPLPGGITSTLLNASFVQLIKWNRSAFLLSSMSLFFWNASGSNPPHSTAKEWSTINCVGTTGLTFCGFPPSFATASRRPARSTNAVKPKISWQITRLGYQGKSLSVLFSINWISESFKSSLGHFRIKFSANTLEV